MTIHDEFVKGKLTIIILFAAISSVAAYVLLVEKTAETEEWTISSWLPLINEPVVADIDYTSTGCFHSIKQRLLISKKGKQFFARLISTSQPTKTIEMNGSQYDAFSKFISELKALPEKGHCTTTRKYVIKYYSQTIIKTDRGCEWNGFDHLIGTLFPDPKR